MRRQIAFRDVCFVGLWVVAAGCDSPGGPGATESWIDGGGAPTPDGGTIKASTACEPAKASEDLGPRVDVLNAIGMAGPAVGGPRVVQVSQLYDQFYGLCGRCHVDTANGNQQTSAASFSTTVDATWLAAIKSDDAKKAMPPDGKTYSSRPDGDPVRQLVALLEPWLAQGRPNGMFTVEDSMMGSSPSAPASAGSYGYAAMTNLGDCIAPALQYAQSPSDEMASKDAFFASATELPTSLSDTDLTTFDGDTLAANGVVAFVPAYPLWSDGSGKLRHIRVPKGTSVKFDKQTQTFTIPPNTRFYKTFFRKVTDSAGRPSNRKIETRLIVARPDIKDADGKTPLPTALFGTYRWSDDELTATLITAEYRDGTRWPDQALAYTVDEPAYRELLMTLGNGSEPSFTGKLSDALRDHPGIVQHYAIPGRIRCVQCHQGSQTKDFVLGFLPFQVARRPNGEGGTYEPTGADELTQLKRLIDYGVITGMTSPSDVVTLEDSQLPRKSRTKEELAAQGYMVGNCMHCNNPRGYPSLVKPELATALNFAPSAGPTGGGIFEFSLETYSPVRARGASQDIRIPYITPSLRDYPVADTELIRMDNQSVISDGSDAGGLSTERTWVPKYFAPVEQRSQVPGAGALSETKRFLCGGDQAPADYCRYKEQAGRHTFVAAPWRSLIYRNVDTPFPYFDDYVPFPHMPMNTAGFDCRAPRIMGEWMVSLPAVRKHPEIPEDQLPVNQAAPDSPNYIAYDNSEQPYRELSPTDPEYGSAQSAAAARLDEYKHGIRYNYCEEILGTDIFDPILSYDYDALPYESRVGRNRPYHPDPNRFGFNGIPPGDPTDQRLHVQPAIGVPYHSHWFNYDSTDAVGDWAPRRGDAWKPVLLDGKADQTLPAGAATPGTPRSSQDARESPQSSQARPRRPSRKRV